MMETSQQRGDQFPCKLNKKFDLTFKRNERPGVELALGHFQSGARHGFVLAFFVAVHVETQFIL